jgi:hypothetical protein
MKTTKYLIILTALMLIVTTSCKKSFFTDANVNPNSPAIVPPSDLLPAIEVNIAYTQGGDFSRYTSIIMQQTTGSNRQAAAYNQYIFTGQDFDGLWANLYSSCMNNAKNLMDISDKNGYNEYSGIARLLMAYTLQMTVDAWGSVPYSQAFQGLLNIHPAYDQDQALYATIQTLISDALTDLNNSDPGALTPGSDDFVYGGSASEWIEFGNALQARIDYHLTKTDPSKAADALTAISSAFQSNSDNAQVLFGADQTASNPWFQFIQQRQDDITYVGSTLSNTMESTHDPRYGALFDSTFSLGQGFGESQYYMQTGSPVEFITYDELQLIKTQCDLISGNGSAQGDFTNAVTANMTKLGVSGGDIATYLAANGTLSSDVPTAEAQVANQQWIALYTNPEAWTTYRLSGSPALVPTGGTNGVPVRFNYSNTELSYNKNSFNSTATLFTPKIFWDN